MKEAQNILLKVAEIMEVTPEFINTKEQNRYAAYVRTIMALELRKAGFTLQLTANVLNRKCHSTIKSMITRHEQLMFTCQNYRQRFNQIQAKLQ